MIAVEIDPGILAVGLAAAVTLLGWILTNVVRLAVAMGKLEEGHGDHDRRISNLEYPNG